MSWKLNPKKIKNYPHFDKPISIANAEKLALDPSAVAKNSFYPFLRYDESWQPFRDPTDIGNAKPKKKSRPISYCARRDAYIFMRYREILSENYEKKLKEYGIQDVPLAYRKIPKNSEKSRGKCNIDFAKDVIDEIKKQGDCIVIALDIKGYFDNLDHTQIEKIWCELMEVSTLPKDHAAVFKAVTQYRFAHTQDVYRRLSYFGFQGSGVSRREGFLQLRSEIPKQLCSNEDFRKLILGNGSKEKSLVRKNWKSRGIPQGSPISDIIANFYLLEYDREMAKYARRKGGSYRRYSDDILFILPARTTDHAVVEAHASSRIRSFGSNLVIKSAKTSVVEFRRLSSGQIFCHQSGEQGANGLEYLGFRYDGTEVFIRDSTISRYFRKIAVAARAEASYLIKKYPGMTSVDLMERLNLSVLLQRWDRVKKFRAAKHDPKKWTFRTYAKRAAETFGNGDVFLKQLSNTKSHLRSRVEKNLVRLLKE